MEQRCSGPSKPAVLAEGALKLELIDAREEIAHVGHVAGDMIFRAGIEIGFGARDGRSDALIFQAKIPPGFVVIVGLDLTGENFPAPFVDHQAERKKRDFLERLLQQVIDVAGGGRNGVDQADLFQIFGSDGERDGVANGFVETIVGAVSGRAKGCVL